MSSVMCISAIKRIQETSKGSSTNALDQPEWRHIHVAGHEAPVFNSELDNKYQES